MTKQEIKRVDVFNKKKNKMLKEFIAVRSASMFFAEQGTSGNVQNRNRIKQ